MAIDLLQPFVPTAIWPTCAPDPDQIASTVVQAAMCHPVTRVPYFNIFYFLYDNAADLKAAVNHDAKTAKATPANSCAQGQSLRTWQTTFADGKVLTGPDFALLCTTSTDLMWIEQAYPSGPVLCQLDGSRLTDLFAWWKSNNPIVVKEP